VDPKTMAPVLDFSHLLAAEEGASERPASFFGDVFVAIECESPCLCHFVFSYLVRDSGKG